ncbi:MAG: TIGR04002 family protein [Terrisporobacter othiniensis]|uniref:TIGR04002 family protein n=1 Tax=Terrisporobacter petrolearius TaxID=1460447 RepID=UPI0022DEB34F|nr:TIGR04002 family protein [Terrisporobacter petrolearius]MDU4861065.1 TIGR04002 family protein [Terrisporobacter othiniensis]MDU6993643.1 TIGR04002 family protein [Terrisporobacter othiniensis]
MENIKQQKTNVSSKTRTLVSAALFAGIICITIAYFLHVPVGGNGGFVHVGDAFIYLAAVLLPTPYAACAAAIGAGMADILTGSANWALATIIIKPILVLFFTNRSKKIINTRNIFAAIIAGIVGTVLYMIAEGIMYGSFVSAFVLSLVGLVQPLGSFIVFVVIGLVFDKLKIKEMVK